MTGSSVSLFANALGAAAGGLAEYFLNGRKWIARPRNVARGLLLVIGVVCAFAFGQPAAPVPAAPAAIGGYSFGSPGQISTAISSAVQAQLSALASNASLTALGDYSCAFFLVALMVWTAVKTMAAGRGFGELIGEWVPIFVAYGIAQLFLNQAAAGAIVNMMDSIAGAIGGGNMSSLDGAVQTCAVPIFKAVSAVVNQPQVVQAASSDGIISSIAAGAASMIMSAIAKVVTGFILVMAGVVMVANVIMGFISVQLVLLLAPLTVPFLMFRPLSWLFDSWLKFLLGACMLKIVVAFLLLVVAALLTATSNLATQFYQEASNASAMEALSADILLLGMMLVFALLSMLLLMQAPGIATGILSGGAGSIGFGGIRGLTQAASSRVVSRGGEKVGGEGWQGMKNTASVWKGRRDATQGRPQDMWYRDPEASLAYKRAYRNNSKPPPAPAPQA